MKLKVTLKVERSYKDESVTDTMTVITPLSSASCGVRSFRIDKKFIIYGFEDFLITSLFSKEVKDALKEEDFVWTHHCVRTIEYTPSDEVIIKELENG